MRLAFVIVILGLAALVSGATYFYVQTGATFVCVPTEEHAVIERYAKAIAEMDEVVDLGLKLSTALSGLGAALLIGLKSGLRLNPIVRCCTFFATALFVQSALYAVWWRTGVAELWLNDCVGLISEPRLSYRFHAHFYFFVGGLISLGLVVVAALVVPPSSTEDVS